LFFLPDVEKTEMKPMPLIIVFLLSFALLIQNTCPFGAAGKTAVSSLGRDCPLKHRVVVSDCVQKNLAPVFSTDQFPPYVFEAPEAIPAFQTAPCPSWKMVRANGYEDALPDELLRPPRV
jgi:hypothetical protein